MTIPAIPRGEINFWKIGSFFKNLPVPAIDMNKFKIWYKKDGTLDKRRICNIGCVGGFLAHLFQTKLYSFKYRTEKYRDFEDGINALFNMLVKLKIMDKNLSKHPLYEKIKGYDKNAALEYFISQELILMGYKKDGEGRKIEEDWWAFDRKWPEGSIPKLFFHLGEKYQPSLKPKNFKE